MVFLVASFPLTLSPRRKLGKNNNMETKKNKRKEWKCRKEKIHVKIR
jgi:hypothetical protein